MDLNNLASSLFKRERLEKKSKLDSGKTTTIYGTATGDSQDGQVKVYISDQTTFDEDDDDNIGSAVSISTSPNVKEGDTVAIALIGSGAMKHPVGYAVVGSGDRTNQTAIDARKAALDEAQRAAEAEEALRTSFNNQLTQAKEDVDSQISSVKTDIDAFKETADSTYATKTEVNEQTGAITTTLTTDYLSKDDASATYATKTELKESSDSLSATISANYSSFTTYQTTNDEAVAQAKSAGVNAQTDLDAYKKTNDSAVSTVTSDLNAYKATTDANLETLRNIADAAIETWYLEGTPTTTNQPAVSWNTDALKKQHSGDLYYDTSNGYAYRWDGSKWNRIADTDITKALGDIEDIKTTYATKSELSATDSELKASISENLETAKTYSSGLYQQEVSDRNSAISESADKIQASVASTYVTTAEFYNTDDSKNMDWEWDPFDFDDGNTETEGLRQYATNTQTDLDGFKTEVSTTYATKADLTITNDSITAEVNARKTTDETVTSLSDNLSKNYSTTTEMNSLIEQTAMNITSTVSQTYVTIESKDYTDDTNNKDWEWDPFDFDDGNTETAGIQQQTDTLSSTVTQLSDRLDVIFTSGTGAELVETTNNLSTLIRLDDLGVAVGYSDDSGKTYTTAYTRVEADGLYIYNKDNSLLASYTDDEINIGVQSTSADIKLLNGCGNIVYGLVNDYSNEYDNALIIYSSSPVNENGWTWTDTDNSYIFNSTVIGAASIGTAKNRVNTDYEYVNVPPREYTSNIDYNSEAYISFVTSLIKGSSSVEVSSKIYAKSDEIQFDANTVIFSSDSISYMTMTPKSTPGRIFADPYKKIQAVVSGSKVINLGTSVVPHATVLNNSQLCELLGLSSIDKNRLYAGVINGDYSSNNVTVSAYISGTTEPYLNAVFSSQTNGNIRIAYLLVYFEYYNL